MAKKVSKTRASRKKVKSKASSSGKPSKKRKSGSIKLKARLILARGDSQGKSFSLVQGDNLIGRWDADQGAFPEVDLEQDDIEAKVSRKHALLQVRGSKVTITDLGSLNGTFVNRGQRLNPHTVTGLKSGDEIVVGKTFLRLEIGR